MEWKNSKNYFYLLNIKFSGINLVTIKLLQACSLALFARYKTNNKKKFKPIFLDIGQFFRNFLVWFKSQL